MNEIDLTLGIFKMRNYSILVTKFILALKLVISFFIIVDPIFLFAQESIISNLFMQESAKPKAKPNPYLHTIYQSIPVNDAFNYYFQKSLEEKEATYKALSKDYDPERFKAQNYLVQLPAIDQKIITPLADTECNLNNPDLISKPENPYPFLPNSKQQNIPYSNSANNAYCLLQSTFQTQNIKKPMMITSLNPISPNKSYELKIKDLAKKDTLVIVIPGIFGEYIPQVTFGEIFGKGLTKLDNPNYHSSFTQSFNEYIKANKLNFLKNKNEGLDSRFLMKNLRSYYINNNYKKLYKLITINQWIKVASLDDSNGNPLFKIALFELEPMSLESLGKQEDLAIIYLRRLNKFMRIYEKQNGKLPDQIIFMGYSRGAPIAYEMLSIIKNGALDADDPEAPTKSTLSSASQYWSNKIIAAVSLGGMNLGTPYFDENVILRNKTPDQARALQALMRLMKKIELLNEDDLNSLKEVFKGSVTNNYVSTNNTYTLYVDKYELAILQKIKRKISINIKEISLFLSIINNLDIKKTGENIGKALLAIKDLATIYEKVNDLLQNRGSNIKQLSILKELFQDLNEEKANKIFKDLIGIGQTMFPNLSNPELGPQEDFVSKVDSLISNPPSLDELTEKISSFVWSNSNHEELLKEINSLISLSSNPEAIKEKLQLLVEKSPDSKALVSKIKTLIAMTPEPEEVISQVQTIVSSAPNPEDLLPIKTPKLEMFIQNIIGNYGFTKSQEIVKKSFENANVISLFNEINLNIKLFRHYFISIWYGASELGTLSRISWFNKHAKYLPTNITYYSVSAVQSSPNSQFFKQGSRFGFNVSSDQIFLNKSWFDFTGIGHNGDDGLDATFAGSTWNDSQVDWYKTILWPHLIKALADDPYFPIKSKVLGIVRTHHWGLALPYVILNQTSTDPNTGLLTYNDQRVKNVNPFPRAELLKSIVMSIDADSSSNLKVKSMIIKRGMK